MAPIARRADHGHGLVLTGLAREDRVRRQCGIGKHRHNTDDGVPTRSHARPTGRANLVDAEVRQEVKARDPDVGRGWSGANRPTHGLGRACNGGRGRYSEVLNHLGDPVDPAHYLVVARQGGRGGRRGRDRSSAAGDLRHAYAVRPVVGAPVPPFRCRQIRGPLAGIGGGPVEATNSKAFSKRQKGRPVRVCQDWNGTLNETSATIDVAMAMAKAWPDGL